MPKAALRLELGGEFTHDSGGTITLPVMGTLTVEDGLITLRRDYFDPTDFDRQLAKIER